MASRIIQAGGTVIEIDEEQQKLRFRDSHLVLNATGVAMALVAVWPFVVVHMRPEYRLTLSGYVVSGGLSFFALVCLWVNLSQGSNDVTVDLGHRTISSRSGLLRRRRSAPLSAVSFTVRDAPVRVLGQETEGVGVFVDGIGSLARMLHVLPEHRAIASAIGDALARSGERPPEETLKRVAAHADSLPKSETLVLFGLLAILVGTALWAIVQYVLAPSI